MIAKLIPISRLHPNTGQVKGLPKNPRIIKDEKFKALVKSIQEDPDMLELREVIAYQFGEELVVIAGNMRLKACMELGIKKIPTKILPGGTSIEKLKAITIKDNIGYGAHDWVLLAEEWDQEQLEDWGMDLPKDFAIDPEAEDDGYEIPANLKSDVVLGDLFEIGPHKLLCGDSTQTDEWAKLFKDGAIADLVVTDPPYNVDYVGKTKKKLKIENDQKNDGDFYQFLYDFYTALGSFCRQGGGWYVWHADSEGKNFRGAMEDAGLLVKQCLIWVKQTMVMGRQDYQWKHEPCLYGWKEGASHKWYGNRKQTTVLNFDRPQRNEEHPTMKPIPLIAYQIGNSSKKGDIVADGFLGSGTTMVASHQLNRICYGMELDPKYCKVIVNRMLKLEPTLIVKRNGKIYKSK